MKPVYAYLAVALAATSLPAAARDIDRLQTLDQAEFRELSRDLGVELSYKPLTPTAPLGTTGELRWAFVQGSTVMPAIGARVSQTRLSGVDQLDFETTGLDVSISKGFAMFTPYAGAGKVWIMSTPVGVAALSGELLSLSKGFVGVSMNLGLVNFALEGDKTGGARTYGVKVGFRF